MHKIPPTLFKFLWYFSWRYKYNLLCIIFVGVYWSIYLSLSPYAMKLIIDTVSDPNTTTENLFDAVKFPVILYISLGVISAFVFRFYDWVMIKTFPKMKCEIISEMFDYVQGHSYNYFQQNFSGSLSNKIQDMARGVATVINHIIEHFVSRGLALSVGAAMMYFVHPVFSYALIIWSVIFITVAALLSKRGQKYSAAFSESRSAVAGKIVDTVTNILNVKLFAREGYESRYLQSKLDEVASKDRRLHWYLLKVKVFYSVAIVSLTTTMVSLLIYERSQHAVTVGDFALILTLTMMLIEEVFFIANQLVVFSEELGVCQQALTIISPKQEIVDEPNAKPLHVSRGEIVFDKVHFQYKKGQSVFADKSIVIHPRQKVGLVGFSGSGKSTFVNLILRFFDLDSGQIKIDGQDIKAVTQASLRSQIGMIPQDPVLFHRTLMDNIRYGRLDATDDEVVECSKKANCHEFIEKLHGQYASLVGERGVKLSGGQRQRIAIARTMLKNAPILILDEATSSLDSVTEHYIQDSLELLMEDRTTIVIAHRLSTLARMDRILVFSDGHIVEDGTHTALLQLNGHYAKMWSMQAGGFLKDSATECSSTHLKEFQSARSF